MGLTARSTRHIRCARTSKRCIADVASSSVISSDSKYAYTSYTESTRQQALASACKHCKQTLQSIIAGDVGRDATLTQANSEGTMRACALLQWGNCLCCAAHRAEGATHPHSSMRHPIGKALRNGRSVAAPSPTLISTSTLSTANACLTCSVAARVCARRHAPERSSRTN